MKAVADLLIGWLVLGTFWGTAWSEPRTQQTSSDELPVPPRQADPWTPPRCEVPQGLLKQAEGLFRHGLADPRGLEYRQIELVAREYDQGLGYGVLSTRGWVLPQEWHKRRMAVAWNGVVYPVVKIGPLANLREDVLAILAADKAEREVWAKENPGERFGRYYGPLFERCLLSHEALMKLKLYLLLRLGEGELAQQYWATWKIGTDEPSLGSVESAPETKTKEDALESPEEWEDSLLDRTICAHLRGDDEVALASARFHVRVRAAIPPPELPRPSTENESAALLLADQERRLALRKAGKGPPAWLLTQTAAAHEADQKDQGNRTQEASRLDRNQRGDMESRAGARKASCDVSQAGAAHRRVDPSVG